MRILHTADWHLLASLGHIDRQPHLVARLEQIAGFLEDRQIDVMLVAGDLFNGIARLSDLQVAIHDMGRVFYDFLAHKGTIITVSGNHDGEYSFKLLSLAIALASPVTVSSNGTLPCGRLYVADGHTTLRLADRHGEIVQFVLLPYPTPGRYLVGEDANYSGIDQRNANLHKAMRTALDGMRRDPAMFNPALPSVLVSHLHVRGTRLKNSLYEISERNDIVFEPEEIPATWEYAAYGHIHNPQMINDRPHLRYAGSIERMDFAEKDDQKSVVTFEIAGGMRIGEPEVLPLDATPLYAIEIIDPRAELPHLAEVYPDAEHAIVKVKVIYQPGKDNPDAIRQDLERTFKNIASRDIVPVTQELSPASITGQASFGDTVTHFLEERFAKHPDRVDLMELASQLIQKAEMGVQK